jgi:hypothetical protein
MAIEPMKKDRKMTTVEKIRVQREMCTSIQYRYLFENLDISVTDMEIVRRVKRMDTPVTGRLLAALERLSK